MKLKFSTFLRLVVSIGLIVFLVWSMRGNLPHVLKALASMNYVFFAFAIVLFMVNVVLLSLRLNLLFGAEGLKISFGRVVQLTYVGYFFNNVMPSAVGGDIVKAYYANKSTNQTAKSFIAVFMDRFIGFFSFILIALFALLWSWGNIDITIKKIVFTFAFFGFIIFLAALNASVAKPILKLLSRLHLWKIGEKLSKVYKAVHEYRNKKGVMLGVVLISLICQVIYFLIVYILSKSLNINLALKMIFLFMPIVSIVSLLPSLGGLGLREGAIVALFGSIIGNDNAFSISILLLMTLFAISIIGAFIYLFASQFRIKSQEISAIEDYKV
ncbi:MAG: lysylphosphatidylglycerol synthase transmembrane domain-containing protein [Candidatus Omnitrophota bacterium]